jgi:4-hydroxybenzoate polyprenyltransferase
VALSLFLVRLGGELIKTARDVVGDSAAQRYTLATVWNSQNTLLLGLASMLVGLLVVMSPAVFSLDNLAYLSIQTLCLCLLGFGFWISRSANQKSLQQLLIIERYVTAIFMLAVMVGLPHHSLQLF